MPARRSSRSGGRVKARVAITPLEVVGTGPAGADTGPPGDVEVEVGLSRRPDRRALLDLESVPGPDQADLARALAGSVDRDRVGAVRTAARDVELEAAGASVD